MNSQGKESSKPRLLQLMIVLANQNHSLTDDGFSPLSILADSELP